MTRALTLLALLIALHGSPVAAQMPCGLYEGFTRSLEDQYKESRIGAGLATPSALFELWLNPENGSWTIIVVFPDGRACVRASGENWQQFEPGIPELKT